MIADALQVLGNEQQVRAWRNVAGVFHHVGDQLAENHRVQIIDHQVRFPDLHRLVRVALADRIDCQFQVLLHQSRHVCQTSQAVGQGELRQDDAALGDVSGIIADAFQITGHLQRGHDLTQVTGYGLAQCQHADHELLDLALERIDRGIGLDRFCRRVRVALDHCRDRERHLVFDPAAHVGHHVAQAFQLLIEAADKVLGLVCHGTSRHLSRTGRSGNPACGARAVQ